MIEIRTQTWAPLLLLFSILLTLPVHASDSLTGLANSIVLSDSKTSERREALAQLALVEQKKRLDMSVARLGSAEQALEQLQSRFDEYESQLADLEQQLLLRTGTLGEVFGVTKQSAQQLIPLLQDSLTGADHRDRSKLLAFADSKAVPTIKDFKSLFEQLYSEMQANGEILSFEAAVVDAQGFEAKQQVLRIGVFSAVSEEGKYLAWNAKDQILEELGTQPSRTLAKKGDNEISVLMDPSRGDLFELQNRMPSLADRVSQGGVVGYLILALGALGMIVALFQLIRLGVTELGVQKELKATTISDTNPLGRVLRAVHNSSQVSQETNESLEMKVDEAILKELPRIEQGQSFLKLLAAVAPLLGLLGTVIGMITTFQSITLFGTSDPKLMADGISQALMTTVLGLVVAVPILFFHSILVSRGKRLVQILQEKSLGALYNRVYEQTGTTKNELHVA